MNEIECSQCGRVFEGLTERTMHVIRKRCPEIESDDDVDRADSLHTLDEIARMLEAGVSDE